MKKDTFGTKIGKKLIEYCIINILVVFGNYARREMRVIFLQKFIQNVWELKINAYLCTRFKNESD